MPDLRERGKMRKFKCKNCDGEFEISTHGELVCPFCGSKQYFTDADFKGYDEFRDNLLRFLRVANDRVAENGDVLDFWSVNSRVEFESTDADTVEISYTFDTEVDGVKVYVSRENVVYVFDGSKKDLVKRMLDNIERIEFPSVDIKNLRSFLPNLNLTLDLKDGSTLVAFSKPENVYPMFAFSNLGPRHVAWMISRMENFACLLEFNGLDFKHMDRFNVFINPKTHEAYLLGGWWELPAAGKHLALLSIRKTAKELTGERIGEGPKEYAQFLNSVPRANAYDDFAAWDDVIENGFGGHNFANFESKEG